MFVASYSLPWHNVGVTVIVRSSECEIRIVVSVVILTLLSRFHWFIWIPWARQGVLISLRSNDRLCRTIRAQFVGIVVIKNGIYIPVDTSCYARHIYLRFSRTSIAQGLSGSPKICWFLGRGRTTATTTNRVSSLLQVRSDEAAIHYGVRSML